MKTIYVEIASGRSWSTDPDAFGGFVFPVEVSDDFTGGAMTYDVATSQWVLDPPYVKTQDDYVRDAESTRSQLRATVQRVTQGWTADLLLGTISDEDKADLVSWREYDKSLRDLDISTAPDITWPEMPE